MDSPTRERLRMMLAIAVRMLPRWVKYELWKRSEPQRTRAEQATVDAILARLDADFEIALKPPLSYDPQGFMARMKPASSVPQEE
jgi:hypothetical protein